MPRTLKITLAYDGTAYQGWQRQAGGVSIQGLVEAALSRLEGAAVTVHGAGRTDAGVHARGQVASALMTTGLGTATLRRALNAILPPDVRALSVEDVPEGFHARFSAVGKVYEYWLFDGDVQPPLARAWSVHRPRRLDPDAMQRAVPALLGEHDFSVFKSAGSPVKSAVRTVTHASVRCDTGHPMLLGQAADLHAGLKSSATTYGDQAGLKSCATTDGIVAQDFSPATQDGSSDRFIVIRVEANGFLRHMVRAIAGTLVEIGEGRRRADSLAALLASRDRGQAGPTAPAQGLVLVRVVYPA